jgi:plastocyanin
MVITGALGLCVAVSACGNGPPDTVGGGGGGPAVGTAAATGLGTPAKKVDETADLKFNPSAAPVKAGDVVEWDNIGSVPHNVTFDSAPALSSQTMQQGDTWQVKFTVGGSYAYHCTFHPGMEGTVTVGG